MSAPIRAAVAVGAGVAAGVLACSLLPERYTFNAPVLHTITGRGGAEAPPEAVFGARIRVPEGFAIGLHADALPGVRFLHARPDGALLATAPRAGTVWRIEPDRDGDGRSDGRSALLEGLDRPHGIDVHEGWLYVAVADGVLRAPLAEDGSVAGEPSRVVDGLPEGGNHWTRTVRIGPDGWMYVSVGSSCNVCFEADERRAALLRFRPDGSQGAIHASGLRNSVGFDWQPETDALYATDNGRDLLGDDFPPCELNRIEAGGFYGWPVANGDRVLDPDLGEGSEARAAASIPPAHAFGAHTAPLGIRFLRHPDQPPAYRGAALVALHGSWNRTEKSGYKVVSLHWNDAGLEERDFAVGFEVDEDVIGRPVDVAEGPDGTIYLSDDYAGSIYRVSHGQAAASRTGRGAVAGAAPAASSPILPAGNRERGAALWETHDCARCHDPGRAAPGVVPVPLASLTGRHDASSLAAFLVAPTPPMPSYDLEASERVDLAAFLLSRFP